MSIQTQINEDNPDLQPLTDGHLVYIDCVDAVNGAAARDVPEFVPTRAELLELLRYWESTFLNRTFFVFETGQIGSTDLRTCPFAERRVNRIIGLLADDAVKAVQEVRDKFAERVGARKWKSFCKYLGSQHLHGAKYQ